MEGSLQGKYLPRRRDDVIGAMNETKTLPTVAHQVAPRRRYVVANRHAGAHFSGQN